MSNTADEHTVPEEYISSVTRRALDILGPNLIALYLHGSAAQSDFRRQHSDIDIIGILDSALNDEQRSRLLAELSHDTTPVHATGLEFILCTAEAAKKLPLELPFEFALSTGPDWGSQYEPPDTATDIIVDLALCRQAGRVLHGPPADETIAPVPLRLLREALVFELEWHRENLHDPSDPRMCENAVLNAARSIHAAQTGLIVSKADGAKLWLASHAHHPLVKCALALREGRPAPALKPEEVDRFLAHAIAEIRGMAG